MLYTLNSHNITCQSYSIKKNARNNTVIEMNFFMGSSVDWIAKEIISMFEDTATETSQAEIQREELKKQKNK